VRIVADTDNNALLIWADKHNQEKIIGALHKLDVARRQVLVEATIAEVTLTGALRYGLQWYFKNDVGNYTGVGSLDLKTNVPINNVLGSGFAYAITDSAGFVRALLDTLASESKLKVLSAPNLMVIDNQEATIRVGTQQPIPGPQSVTTGIVTSSTQYKDTGVLLQVRPQINAGGLVTMDINQAVTDVGPIDSATGQRTFDQRTITSRVAVQSGQSIVLGGLIRDRQIDSDSGIPGLYKIPLLGALFGKTDNLSSRTELVVLITPKVVENSQDNQNIIDDLREKMKAVAPMVLGS
jgi:general secretion pathway protein D